MNIRHVRNDLEQVELDPNFNNGWGPVLVRAYRKVMNILRNCQSTRELGNWKGGRLEKLRGDYQGFWSLRLNDQWRLIVSFENDKGEEVVVINEVVDYH